jgi:hypothetical protein
MQSGRITQGTAQTSPHIDLNRNARDLLPVDMQDDFAFSAFVDPPAIFLYRPHELIGFFCFAVFHGSFLFD